VPFDSPNHPDNSGANKRPLAVSPDLTDTHTEFDYKTALLQRLANPLLPWNPKPGIVGHNGSLPVNPYITVDWMSLDLTVFNGSDKEPSGQDPNRPSPWDPDDDNPQAVVFGAREWGTNNANIWSRSFDNRPTAATYPRTVVAGYFDEGIHHTLGYLNKAMVGGARRQGPTSDYVGDPSQPIPWLTWLNRPFNNRFELLMVPATSQERLLFEFTTANTASDPYDAASSNVADYRAPFGHLLNFFHTRKTGAAPHYYRLLDYAAVPSRYVGAHRWHNPAAPQPNPPLAGLEPPYNRVSLFRDPGKVNINTIFQQSVFESVMRLDSTTAAALWSQVQESRQGFSGNPLNASWPTQFVQPFRAATAADLAPLPAMETTGAEAGFMRSRPGGSKLPLFAGGSGGQYADASKNPYFYYQNYQRAASQFSTHSNVYAVWVTVGFFEAHPNLDQAGNIVIDAGRPDGYQLGLELGLDQAQSKRRRAFFIIDRSIPVGFEPGADHNVDDCIRLRRLIE